MIKNEADYQQRSQLFSTGHRNQTYEMFSTFHDEIFEIILATTSIGNYFHTFSVTHPCNIILSMLYNIEPLCKLSHFRSTFCINVEGLKRILFRIMNDCYRVRYSNRKHYFYTGIYFVLEDHSFVLSGRGVFFFFNHTNLHVVCAYILRVIFRYS